MPLSETQANVLIHFRRGVGFIDEDGLDEWEPWSDPLKASATGLVAKAPTKAFSTLNELVRHYLRLVDDNPVIPGVDSEASDLDGSIVCILLRNAMSKQERVQPSELVAGSCNSVNGKPLVLGWTPGARPDLHPTWVLPDDFPIVSETNARRPQSSSQQSHPFMTMPDDGGQTGSDLAQTEMDIMWPTFQSPLQLASTPAGMRNASLDVFDELATLERQESAQNPHFMQNLGFPDLDLAEFFGADYRPNES